MPNNLKPHVPVVPDSATATGSVCKQTGQAATHIYVDQLKSESSGQQASLPTFTLQHSNRVRVLRRLAGSRAGSGCSSSRRAGPSGWIQHIQHVVVQIGRQHALQFGHRQMRRQTWANRQQRAPPHEPVSPCVDESVTGQKLWSQRCSQCSSDAPCG